MTLLLLSRLRKNLLPGQKFRRYLVYALGEILLIVTGILVALGLNNQNAEKNRQHRLNETYKLICKELKADSTAFGYTHRAWMAYDSLYTGIIAGRVGADEYKADKRYITLLGGYPLLPLHQSGYQLLISSEGPAPDDSLALIVLDYYANVNRFVPEMEANMAANVTRTLDFLKMNTTWYSDMLIGTPNEAFVQFATTDPRWRNMVHDQYIYVYQNYLSFVGRLLPQMKLLIEALEQREEPA